MPDKKTRPTENWYAVHTNAQQEGNVAAKLWRYFPVFLPRRWVTIKRNRRMVSELRVLMPRYLMAKCGPDGFHIINTTVGVSTLINVGGAPRPVPDKAMAMFRSFFDQDGIVPRELFNPTSHDLKPGDRVRLTDGPLEGLVAKVEALDGSDRIRVLAELFGRLVSTSASAEWAELVG